MISSFPKIFALGQCYIKDIFKGEVEITEKIDGSQFVFGNVNSNLYMRSKGKVIYKETVDKMFRSGVDYILSLESLPMNAVFYCEYLAKPKHNVLKYEKTPKNNLILFGVYKVEEDKFVNNYDELKRWGDMIDIETVPLLYRGKVDSLEEIIKFLDMQSILGGTKLEGIVVKNYDNPFLLGGQPIPIMMGKYVSEKFKEQHSHWAGANTGKGRWQTYVESFKTEARWNKAIQHLKEKGELEHSPRDIGKLIKEIITDINEENKEDIKEFLWNQFGREVTGAAVRNFAEWYKLKLAESGFQNKEEEEKLWIHEEEKE